MILNIKCFFCEGSTFCFMNDFFKNKWLMFKIDVKHFEHLSFRYGNYGTGHQWRWWDRHKLFINGYMKINRKFLRYELSLQCLAINYEWSGKKIVAQCKGRSKISIWAHNVTHFSWWVLFVGSDNLREKRTHINQNKLRKCIVCVCVLKLENINRFVKRPT